MLLLDDYEFIFNTKIRSVYHDAEGNFRQKNLRSIWQKSSFNFVLIDKNYEIKFFNKIISFHEHLGWLQRFRFI